MPAVNQNEIQGVSSPCYKDSFANLNPTLSKKKTSYFGIKTLDAKFSLWIHIVVLFLISEVAQAMEIVQNIQNTL